MTRYFPIIIPNDNIATDMITFTNKDLVLIISFLFEFLKLLLLVELY